MRYKEVSVEYKSRKMKVIVHIDGQETDEELQSKAIEILDKTWDEPVLRHFGMEVENE